jgi:hypothetical protein
VEGTSQTVLGSSDQEKVPASLSLFLKSEKIPALLYIGKGPEYMPFDGFRPFTSAYRPGGGRDQIMEGPVSRPFPIQSTTHQRDRKSWSDFLTIIKGIVSSTLFFLGCWASVPFF